MEDLVSIRMAKEWLFKHTEISKEAYDAVTYICGESMDTMHELLEYYDGASKFDFEVEPYNDDDEYSWKAERFGFVK